MLHTVTHTHTKQNVPLYPVVDFVIINTNLHGRDSAQGEMWHTSAKAEQIPHWVNKTNSFNLSDTELRHVTQTGSNLSNPLNMNTNVVWIKTAPEEPYLAKNFYSFSSTKVLKFLMCGLGPSDNHNPVEPTIKPSQRPFLSLLGKTTMAWF